MLPPSRGRPLPDLEGDAVIQVLLAEIEEEERLSAAIGEDLTPPAPKPEHAPARYPPLRVWLERSEEVHALRERAWRAERGRKRG
jgi:hypothetical protein